MADKNDSCNFSQDERDNTEGATGEIQTTENTETLKKFQDFQTCDTRFLTLDCMVDNGGTPDGCHTEAFDSFKQLLKHNLEAHRGLKHRCQFYLVFFLIVKKIKLNMKVNNMTHII